MRNQIPKMLGILLIGLATTGSLLAQQGAGTCTNYGCKVVNFMSTWDDYLGWYECIDFFPGNGRMVRNATGSQGGRLQSFGQTTARFYGANSACPLCTPPVQPNSFALDGMQPGGMPLTTQNWQRYICLPN